MKEFAGDSTYDIQVDIVHDSLSTAGFVRPTDVPRSFNDKRNSHFREPVKNVLAEFVR